MFGPKLDARSWTHLLLIVIASLLSINIIAQGTRDRIQSDNPRSSAYRDNSVSSEADATRELAEATLMVAESNKEIARAISEVADAISGLDMTVTVNNQGGSSRGDSTSPSPSPAGSTGSGEDEEPSVQGTFELN